MTHRFAFDIPDQMWNWMQKNLKKGRYGEYLVEIHNATIRNDPIEQEKKRIRQRFYEEKIIPELRNLQDTYEYQSNDYSFLLEHFGNQKIALSRNDLITCMDQLDQEVMAE